MNLLHNFQNLSLLVYILFSYLFISKMERALGFAPKPLGMEFQGVAQQLLAKCKLPDEIWSEQLDSHQPLQNGILKRSNNYSQFIFIYLKYTILILKSQVFTVKKYPDLLIYFCCILYYLCPS